MTGSLAREKSPSQAINKHLRLFLREKRAEKFKGDNCLSISNILRKYFSFIRSFKCDTVVAERLVSIKRRKWMEFELHVAVI